MDAKQEDVKQLVEGLNFAQKVDRSLRLIREAYEEYGDRLAIANSLGKDSVAVWHLTKRVNPAIRGFIITTRFKPKETINLAWFKFELKRVTETIVSPWTIKAKFFSKSCEAAERESSRSLKELEA